ncbi:error-prone DNA polymerase [Tistrella bauzanensis]|uniref:error-prone DNA polymerase n=1 Tax=Tistrella TaxID=171436 RepID=UPI0031F71153
MQAPECVELEITSNYSFLRGASHPEELVATAAAHGFDRLAIADRASLAGVVRAYVAARKLGMVLHVGARLDPADAPPMLVYPRDRAAYGRLCRLLTLGKRRAPKGGCDLRLADILAAVPDHEILLLPPMSCPAGGPHPDWDLHAATAARLAAAFPDAVHLAARHLLGGDDDIRIGRIDALAGRLGIDMVATGDVRMHVPERRVLADLLVCIREHVAIDQAGHRLARNADRYLKPPAEMMRRFARYPDAIAASRRISDRLLFRLDELSYDYPLEGGLEGETPQGALERRCREGLAWRYPARLWPDGPPPEIKARIRTELDLIGRMGYAPYFLTVDQIVRFARDQGILAQGRGSAANSVVCFLLGITAADPSKVDLLFERFISEARDEPPDIDVDFEHERREEVIQHIYTKYGRAHAALAATVISYRPKSALRDAGRALGLDDDTTGRLSGLIWGRSDDPIGRDQLIEAGLDADAPRIRATLTLAASLLGFPRHLSQHVGGFVLTRRPLEETVPIGNAAMPDRTFVEWDKDDLDALGILKIDILALGMLTALRKGFDLIAQTTGRHWTMATVPPEDPAVYDMLCRADAVGVFQVESRAQLNMLPRLRPRAYYDLVIEVAIVRPGPIQGDMVHPYLRRRAGLEPVEYPSEALRMVLQKTLGVPLFQEQAMRIAMVAGGFSGADADALRRSMAAFRRSGSMHRFHDQLIGGMIANGYDPVFAERCFKQLEGFGEYGFPESHAASFALIVYVSAWMKCHHPAAFTCALLNSQPMGFYAPAQLIRDAASHGVEIRPVDINHSAWDCTLEPGEVGKVGQPALRLGLRLVKGLAEADGRRLVATRPATGHASPAHALRAAAVPPAALIRIAEADGFRGLNLDRRQALWALRRLETHPLPLFAGLGDDGRMAEPAAPLPATPPARAMVEDYAATGLTLRRHPMTLIRAELGTQSVVPVASLAHAKSGSRTAVAGLVTTRQRPGTAKGIIFITLEDETGHANLIVRPDMVARYRVLVHTGRVLVARGRVERSGQIIHLLVEVLDTAEPALTAAISRADDAATAAHLAALNIAAEPTAPSEPPALRLRSRDFH